MRRGAAPSTTIALPVALAVLAALLAVVILGLCVALGIVLGTPREARASPSTAWAGVAGSASVNPASPLANTGVAATLAANAAASLPTLAAHCPTGFVERAGRCYLDSIYQHYDSLQGQGVGGLKTGLPQFRDGFTPQQIDLGRLLFFDPLLSADRKVSCAHCHNPAHAFSDALARSRGEGGQEVARNAPSLWNVGFLNKLFLDGRANSLEEQVQGPLYGSKEMGNTPEALRARINGVAAYRALFAAAYPDAADGIEARHVYAALAAFESSLVSLNSRYDLYANGVAGALSAHEIEGLNVFRSFVARCAECHTPPLFSNQQIAVIGMPQASGTPFDPGAEASTHLNSMRGGFKVPSLRNVALTAPYTHSGAFTQLRDVVAFYSKGRGHAVPANEKLALHWHIWNPQLTDREIDRVVDFLQTLTDESFMPAAPAVLPSGLQPGA
jgi:cytochrome c peroxidase